MSVRLLALGLAAMAVASILPAQGVALAPKVGTTGIGADLTIGLARFLNLRVGAQSYTRRETRREREIEYDADLKLLSGEILLDLHPGGRGFRISGGAIVNGNEVTAISSEDAVYTINGVQYPVGLVGRLRGRVDTNDVAPYLGIGWGNAVAPGGRWRFALDAGAFYQGKPKVSLTAEPLIPALVPPRFAQDLEAERRKVEDDLDSYRFYPVLSLGVSYRF
ncbi:MAG TPA: hypothetical protein VGK86_02795 [Thermoanaerobaculia bacterium]